MAAVDDPTNPYNPDDRTKPTPPAGPSTSFVNTSTVAPAQTRYNTTPMWQDAGNPPSPGDPYWADWIAVNPNYRGQGYNGPTTPAAAPPPTTTTTTGNGGIDFTAPFTGTFTPPTPAPMPATPVFTAPPYTPPPAFSYDAFTAPTETEAANDPGYKFASDAGNQAFMNNRAAAGVAGTGGTIKDFINYNQAAATQQYNGVYTRDLNTYATNRGNALDTYNTNYKTQYADPWSFADTAAQQAYSGQLAGFQTDAANTQHENDVANTNTWNQYLQNFDIFDAQRKFVAGGQAASLQ